MVLEQDGYREGGEQLEGTDLVEFCELFVKCFMCFNQRSVSIFIPATRGKETEEERGGKGRGGKLLMTRSSRR